MMLFTLVTQNAFAVASSEAYRVRNFYCDIADFISGPIGVLVGISIALMGFYKFLMSGAMSSLGIILVGVLVPMFPSVYASFSIGVAEAFPASYLRENAQDATMTPGHTAETLNGLCGTFGNGNRNIPNAPEDPDMPQAGNKEDNKADMKKETIKQQGAAALAVGQYYGTIGIQGDL